MSKTKIQEISKEIKEEVMFIKLTNKSDGGPILINIDAVECIDTNKTGGVRVWSMHDPDGHYRVSESFEEVCKMLDPWYIGEKEE